MNVPAILKYTEDHEWIKAEGEFAYIGVTDYAQQQLGDVVFVEIETLGENLAKGDIFGSIEAVKTVSDLFMPIGGEILEVNPKLEQAPELINTDPYGQGWMIKIKMDNAAELDELLSASDYQNTIA